MKYLFHSKPFDQLYQIEGNNFHSLMFDQETQLLDQQARSDSSHKYERTIMRSMWNIVEQIKEDFKTHWIKLNRNLNFISLRARSSLETRLHISTKINRYHFMLLYCFCLDKYNRVSCPHIYQAEKLLFSYKSRCNVLQIY